MKNIKHLLLATVGLISASSMAVLMQPGTPTTEEAPMQFSVGGNTGIIVPEVNGETKFGINNLSGGIGFTHNLGYDFEYGLGVKAGWAAPGSAGEKKYAARIFTDDTNDLADPAKKRDGFRLDVELMARFMPELAEKFHLGAVLGAGWGMQFGGEDGTSVKAFKDATKFGDLAFRVGPAMSFGFSDMVSMYAGANITLTNVRFADSTKVNAIGGQKAFDDASNHLGMEIPVGFTFSVADNVSMFVEANTQFTNFKAFKEGFKEDVTLGVSFAM